MKKNNMVIVNNESGMIFATSQKATKTLNVNNGSWSKCVNGKRATVGKYNAIKLTFRKATKREVKAFMESKYYEDGVANLKDLNINDKRKNKKVILFDDNGHRVFDSIIKCNEFVGGDCYHALNNNHLYKGKYKVMYYTDYLNEKQILKKNNWGKRNT